jgi:tyrosinase
MSHVVITGGSGGGAPNRLEINTLIQPANQDLFSLYIQALSKFPVRFLLPLNRFIDSQTDAIANTSQDNPFSQFGIGGIHGLPYVQWEGAGGTQPVQGSDWGGYCTHGSVLFPSWHRPYVALYEVGLISQSQSIPSQY